MQVKPMTPKEIMNAFDFGRTASNFDKDADNYLVEKAGLLLDIQNYPESPYELDDDKVRGFLRSSLRALLLHVGESLPTPIQDEKHSPQAIMYKEGYAKAIDDCKRVIDKMIEEI